MEILVNNQKISLEKGQTGFDLLKILNPENKKDILIYEQNGQKFDLSEPIVHEGEIVLIARGASARWVFDEPNEAIDLAIVGIVDSLSQNPSA